MSSVVDASAIIELLLVRGRFAALADLLLGPGRVLHAPHLIDAEVVQVLRRLEQAGTLSGGRAEDALHDYSSLRIVRHGHEPLLGRAWDLRQNLSAYDALNVVLAEGLRLPLVTLDRRIATAPGHTADITVP